MTELILTCRTCGSEFTLPEGTPMRACPSCGTEHSRPRAAGGALEALRRAHQQRAACDFTNAAHSYQHVLIDHPREHEALWGLVLCRYGVEYVTDGTTGRRLPTMHFMQRRPITQDADFALACQYAPEGVRSQYARDAEYILRIQQGVWAAQRSCQPCDVFLCYKASDADGGKTREFEHARELYFHLIADGYRIFFAHESLQQVSGANYEAQIFHALQSARVLLLVCSDPAHLITPWVHSEWSRFLERADENDGLRLIPLLCDGIAPEALPAPILTRRLEGLRMGELTSYNRLCRSLTAVIGQAPAPDDPPAAPTKNAPAARRPWRAALALVIVLAGLAGAWFAWNGAQTDGVRTPEASPTAAAALTEEPAVEAPVEEPAVEAPVEEPAIQTATVTVFDPQPVTVTLSWDAAGAIAALTVDASSLAPGFGDLCTDPDWLGQFIGKKGPFIAGVNGVDTITNATITSTAVINAINILYPQTASATGFGDQPVTVTLTLDATGAIAGLTVDASTQTPGIGGRCGSETWLDQFIGKKGPFVLGQNGVDAMTGATITARAVINAINSLLPAVR